MIRLVASVLLVFPVGFEREAKDKNAGLRTIILVSLGAAGFVLAVVQAPAILRLPTELFRFDPTGLIAAVAAGIGFLVAGAIFSSGGRVKGMTTGATIWLAGTIGVACGVGQIILAVLLTLATCFVVIPMKRMEKSIRPSENSKESRRRTGE